MRLDARHGEELGVEEFAGEAASRAHGAQVDRPVSPRARVVHRRCGLAAHLAASTLLLENPRQGLLRDEVATGGQAASQHAPKLLAEAPLPLGIGDHSVGQRRPRLPHPSGFFFAPLAAVGRFQVQTRPTAVRAGWRLRGERLLMQWLLKRQQVQHADPQVGLSRCYDRLAQSRSGHFLKVCTILDTNQTSRDIM